MKRFILVASMLGVFAAAGAPRAGAELSEDDSKRAYVKKIHAEIDELSGKIDALEQKAKKAGASAHKGMDQHLKEIKARRKSAKKDLAKLKRASGKAWSELKTGVDKGIEDIRKALAEIDKD